MNASLAPVIELPLHRFVCSFCGCELPRRCILPGDDTYELPDDFACPVCGVGKEWLIALPRRNTA